MACPSFKIDSNDTGLRFAVEKCLRELPSTANTPPDPMDPIWYALEPNSYGDMGANITTVARNPINPSRQHQHLEAWGPLVASDRSADMDLASSAPERGNHRIRGR